MMKRQAGSLLDEVAEVFDRESNLIRLEGSRAVFVGDTHGDVQATRSVIRKYLNSENQIVFLGDYVDRGPASFENMNFLFSLKLKYPDNLFLLMGNHEGCGAIEVFPADFWDSLPEEIGKQYATVLSLLPLAASTENGVIALHGALPDVSKLDDVDMIEFGSKDWWRITWGDWDESDAGYLSNDSFTGRPRFGQGWFDKIMDRIGKNVLIRSHQPNVEQVMYDRRCLTIFTSLAYLTRISQRTIAVVDLGTEIRSANDLTIETV